MTAQYEEIAKRLKERALDRRSGVFDPLVADTRAEHLEEASDAITALLSRVGTLTSELTEARDYLSALISDSSDPGTGALACLDRLNRIAASPAPWPESVVAIARMIERNMVGDDELHRHFHALPASLRTAAKGE